MFCQLTNHLNHIICCSIVSRTRNMFLNKYSAPTETFETGLLSSLTSGAELLLTQHMSGAWEQTGE